MADYTTLPGGFIRREADNAIIPNDPGNADYQTYLIWLAAGETPAEEPEQEPAPYTLTKLQIYARMTDAELDALDGFLSTYATTRERRTWNDLVEIVSNDMNSAIAVATALFGAPRAAELLAPL